MNTTNYQQCEKGWLMRVPSKVLAIASVLGLTVALVPVAGLGAASAAPAKEIKIGFVNLADSIPYAVEVEQGVEAVAKKDHVQVVTCDSDLSVPQAISCVEAFKTEGVQGIADYQSDEAAAPRVCAAGPKVPVVAVDIEQPPCEKVYVGVSNFAVGHVGGVMLGTFAKTHWDCKVNALMSINSPINPGVIAREDGEIAGVLAVCPGLKVTKVEPTTYTTDATIAPFTDTLSRFPGATHILVLAINDDVGIGAVKAAQSVGRLNDIYVVAQGASSDAYPYICQATPFKNWVGDVNYNPQTYGALIVPALVNLIAGKKVPAFQYVKAGPLTKANINSVFPGTCK
jgi:ribose transport system substrate-binding protein